MAPPVRTDDQILPRIRWVPIGKATATWIWKNHKAAQSTRLRWISCRTPTSSGPLQLPLPFHQFTSSSSGIRSNMTRKLGTTGVSWMNSGLFSPKTP
uniref:Uncharacterized protein n=1 Tax=Tanacetum cinerariifolium TaxID=118510 RepID=A0A699U2V5_TANCI|nr:hypothetical protein [Tanacetum cinerariifolium]